MTKRRREAARIAAALAELHAEQAEWKAMTPAQRRKYLAEMQAADAADAATRTMHTPLTERVNPTDGLEEAT